MEEKDVKFNLVKLADDGDTVQIGVTSDIDDFPDYLDTDECVAIIASLVSKCVNQVMGVDDTYVIEDFDENDKEHTEKLNKVHEYTSSLVHLVLNVINNTVRANFNLEPDNIECSVVTLEDCGDGEHQPLDTIYSENTNILDPLQSVFPLMVDTTTNLLENGVAKAKVKNLMVTSLNLLKGDIINLIDDM